MKRTKKNKTGSNNNIKGGSVALPARCSFVKSTRKVNKTAINTQLNTAQFLKGESFGFTEFFKKSIKLKCSDDKIVTCYNILKCFNKTRDISDMLYDIFNPNNEKSQNESELLKQFADFFIMVIDIIFMFIKKNPTAENPILLLSLSRQFDILFNYDSKSKNLMKYIRAKVTEDTELLSQYNNNPIGNENYIINNRGLFESSEELVKKITENKDSINKYYNDKMQIFLQEDKEVKMYDNPDYKNGKGKKGYGDYFIIFIISMLGL